MPLLGRSGILDEHQNNFFCGVCCGKGDRSDTVYAITESGLLCEFNNKRRLTKWVLLRVGSLIVVVLLGLLACHLASFIHHCSYVLLEKQL